MPERVVSVTLKYQHDDGTIIPYKGMNCFKLSVSFQDAVNKIKEGCQQRGETYKDQRIILNTQPRKSYAQ